MIIHVECLPDEVLVKKLGFFRKDIRHHNGKSRVFAYIKNKMNQLAIVDEDPDSIVHPYQRQLKLIKGLHGIQYFLDDKMNNKIFVLKIKLEDWVIAICKNSPVRPNDYGLPNRANSLHDVINNRLEAFEKLLSKLVSDKNPAIEQLKEWLHSE